MRDTFLLTHFTPESQTLTLVLVLPRGEDLPALLAQAFAREVVTPFLPLPRKPAQP